MNNVKLADQEGQYRSYNDHRGEKTALILYVFVREIDILQESDQRHVNKELGVISVTPGKSKVAVLNEFGFPVISKRIAGKIETLQNPTEKNKTVRHTIITGECG